MSHVHSLAKKWAQKVVELHALPVPPSLEPRKQKLLNQAQFIKSALEKSDALAPLTPVASELGFIPLIVAGGIAATAAMTKWITDASKISSDAGKAKQDADAINKLIASGMSKEQAYNIVMGARASTFDIKKLIIPALLVGGGILAFTFIKKARA